MRLSDYRQTYYEFSGTASEVARKLAFAGIAFVWIFKTSNGTTPGIPHELILPAGLLVLALALDLFQYVAATAIWGVFQWREEAKLRDINDDPELCSPRWFKWPQMILFILKLVAVCLCYVILCIYVWRIWL